MLEKEESSSVKNFEDEKHEVCLSKLKILNLDLVGKHKLSKLSTGIDSKPDKRLWTLLNSNKSAKNNKTPNIRENNKGATNKPSINGLLSIRFFHQKLSANISDCAKYYSAPNFDHLESSLTDIKDSLFGLETLLKHTDRNEFMDNIKDRELISENNFLKMKVKLLEKRLEEKDQRIKMLEKLVLETHL